MSSGTKALLRFKKLSEQATTPSRGSKDSAGYDLYSAQDMIIPACGKGLVPTDLQVEAPKGCYGRIAPRSGLAVKHHIDVGGGVIDRDYRGNVYVCVFNFGSLDFTVKKGDRIAQLICEKILQPQLEEVEQLEKTERGAEGFGSTGMQ